MVEQTGLTAIHVTWTRPEYDPPSGYRVAVDSAGISEAVSGTTYTLTLTDNRNYTVRVWPLSQHYPGVPVSLDITLMGKQ